MTLSRRQIKESESYKRLTRNREYRNPSGFTPWANVCERICSLASIEINGAQMDTRKALCLSGCEFIDKNGPAFWLPSELGEALWNSELPERLPVLPQVSPIGVVLLPDVAWINHNHNWRCEFALFRHLRRGEHTLEGGTVATDDGLYVAVVSGKALVTTYVRLSGALADLHIQSNEFRASSARFDFVTDKEMPQFDSWRESFAKLIYQCLLILSTQPDLADTATELPPTKGFGKTHRKLTRKERLLNPRWIGKPDFRVKRESQGGTHAAPVTHWRRGHWRRTPVGPKDKGERKLNWIQPVIVNAS